MFVNPVQRAYTSSRFYKQGKDNETSKNFFHKTIYFIKDFLINVYVSKKLKALETNKEKCPLYVKYVIEKATVKSGYLLRLISPVTCKFFSF